MKFGLFGSAQAKRGGADLDSGAGFRDFIEYNVEAEALGYDSTFVVEHHFTGFGQVSASLNLLTWVAARTSTLRLGTAVLVLPWHNPVLLAEQAATIDLLSNGRLEFGVGKGYRHNEFSGFCIPIAEADERFEESLVRDPEGVDQRRALLAPRQVLEFREHRGGAADASRSRIRRSGWRRASRTRSARWRSAARSCCSTSSLRSPGSSSASTSTRPRWSGSGRRFDPMDVGVARAFYVAKDAEDKRKAVEARLANQRRMTELAAAPGAVKSSMLSFDYTLDAAEESAMYGTPDEIAAKLDRLRAAGIEHVLLNGAGGAVANLRRFAHEVMPAYSGEKRAAAE